jgi:hypothetical protein
MFALAAHIYRSDNAGSFWTNITAFGDSSVIGSGQRDIALSPVDPDLLVVANDYAVVAIRWCRPVLERLEPVVTKSAGPQNTGDAGRNGGNARARGRRGTIRTAAWLG